MGTDRSLIVTIMVIIGDRKLVELELKLTPIAQLVRIIRGTFGTLNVDYNRNGNLYYQE